MLYSSSSSQLSSSAWRGLPSVPGVYIYKDSKGQIIYVGKAKNLKSRVSSYFQPPARLGPKTAELVSKISTLEYIEVNSETEALLLESRLIKKFKPFYNIVSKDDKSPYYIHITKEAFPRPIIDHNPMGAIAGPFLNSLVPRRILNQFRHIAPYCIAPRPVKKPCFYSHIGLCDPCPALDQKTVYQKNIFRLKRLLSGNFSTVRSNMTRDMAALAKDKNYENAAKIRDQINSLDYLLSQPILPEEYLVNPNLAADTRQSALDSLKKFLSITSNLHRIEMYDNAHLSGTSATGAMVVAVDGQINTSQYRHFTIKTAQSNSDVDMMKEVLSRRLKRSDWPKPDLIVLDGGIPQLSSVISIVKSDNIIPIISLAKQKETIIIPYKGSYKEVNLNQNDPGLQLIQRLRDEAHRFSRRLHHKHRSQDLLK